jgi:Flp pilus assembly pilin Flp
MKMLKNFLRDEQGQDLVEYTLLLAFVHPEQRCSVCFVAQIGRGTVTTVLLPLPIREGRIWQRVEFSEIFAVATRPRTSSNTASCWHLSRWPEQRRFWE